MIFGTAIIADGVRCLWVAARFTEEHRAALDWLNKITDESFRFFGLEVELWRIGESPPAPKFNVISKPNDWSRSVAQAARAIDDDELSETRSMQRAYWDAFHPVLDKVSGPISGNRKAQPQSWMNYPIGRTGFNLGTVMIRPKRQIRSELYISGENAKVYFYQLREQKAEIERELGQPLEWEELPSRRDCRISIYLNDVDPGDAADWPRQHQWLASRLNDMHRVFARRVRALDADAWNADDRSDEVVTNSSSEDADG